MKGYNVRNSLKQWLHTTCDERVTLQKENRLLRNKLVDKKTEVDQGRYAARCWSLYMPYVFY